MSPSALVSDFDATAPAGATYPPVLRPPVGWITQDDGRVALGAAVPLGVLTARQAEFVAAIDAPVVITPWRSLLVCDLPDGVADTSLRVLAPMGLVFDDNSPWLDISACVGSPGCEKSLADVRAEASRVALEEDVTRARALRGLRAGVRQPPDGPGAGGDGGGVPAGRTVGRRVGGCSTTFATPPRSTGSRSRRFAPKPT